MLCLMNSKNKNTKKDLRLAYSQGNNTAYPIDIKSAARNLSTQYPNNKLTNQCEGHKGNKRKVDDPKSEDKDSNTDGTADTHVEDTTTNKDTTAPSGGASIGISVSETNQALSCQSRMVDEILGAHPVNDDFWDNINLTDVSIDTVNNEEKIAGSHITKFHTHKDKQPLVEDLLSQEDQDYNNWHDRQLMTCNVEDLLSQEDGDYDNWHDWQLMTCKYDTGQGHHNPSNQQSTKSVHYELDTGKDESFSYEVVKM